MHGHRDVTVEGPEEARHLVHYAQGHELVPGRLQATKSAGGTPKAAEKTARTSGHLHDDFAPTIALALTVPSLLPQSTVVLIVLVRGLTPA